MTLGRERSRIVDPHPGVAPSPVAIGASIRALAGADRWISIMRRGAHGIYRLSSIVLTAMGRGGGGLINSDARSCTM